MKGLYIRIFLLTGIWFVFSHTVFSQETIGEPVQLDTNKRAEGFREVTIGASFLRTPVIQEDDTLFYLYFPVDSTLQKARAKRTTEKIKDFFDDEALTSDSLRIIDYKDSTVISAAGSRLLTLTPMDTVALNLPRYILAENILESIKSKSIEIEEDRSLINLLFQIGYTLLTTVLMFIALMLISKLFPKLFDFIGNLRDAKIRSVSIQNVQLISADRITDILLVIARFARAAVFVLLFYFYFTLVFSYFPATNQLGGKLFDYIIYPFQIIFEKFVEYLPNMIFVLIIIGIIRYVIKFTRFIFNEMKQGNFVVPGFYPEWIDPTYKIVRFLLIALGVILIFPYLPGSDSDAFKGISIFLGVLISLGSTGAVANIVAGLMITYMRPFSIGDRVKIASTVGDVIEKDLLITRIRTIKNVDVTIPNSMILASHIINYSSSAKEKGLTLHLTITISYDVPWRKIHQLLIDAAKESEDILAEPAPYVLQTALDDFYVLYELNAYTTKPNKMAKIYSSLYENIQDKFNEAQVEIMSPHFSAVRDGSRISIPDDYLPKDYEQPPFRIFGMNIFGGNKEK